MTLTYGSVCSGIEAASVAWKPLGWATSFVSEIEAAPRAVLQHRFPTVPLHGDFTTIREGEYGAIDLLVGGTPCQSFSVAGLRGGLADDRGNLALEYLRLAQRLRPRWLVWENVPGVLSSNGGRDFGAILGGMVELGYRFAYRVLDAQYVRVDGFGRAVPQRRRRVFVVGHLGDWRRPAAVLFERACLRGDPAPRREAGAGIAVGALAGTGPGGGWRIGPDEAAAGQLVAAPFAPAISASNPYGDHESREGLLVAALTAGDRGISPDQACGNMIVPVAGTLCSNRKAAGSATNQDAQNGMLIAFQATGDGYWREGIGPLATSDDNGTNQVVAFSCKDHGADATDAGVAPTMRAMGHGESHANAGGQLAIVQPCADALTANWHRSKGAKAGNQVGLINPIITGWSVRRLTPTECERLQGFPDGWTAVPWRGGTMPDGPRYKMLGNSMAVNVMRWIGRRIEAVDALDLQTVRAA